MGDEETAKTAKQWFLKATQGPEEPKQAFFYYDESPDKIYYQGLAWRALGDEKKAKERFIHHSNCFNPTLFVAE